MFEAAGFVIQVFQILKDLAPRFRYHYHKRKAKNNALQKQWIEWWWREHKERGDMPPLPPCGYDEAIKKYADQLKEERRKEGYGDPFPLIDLDKSRMSFIEPDLEKRIPPQLTQLGKRPLNKPARILKAGKLMECLEKEPLRILIYGDAGLGKTALLQYMTLYFAQKNLCFLSL